MKAAPHTLAKQWLKQLLGLGPVFVPKVQCPRQWYGNRYGGFYACPAVLGAQSVVYSVGIGEDVSFDSAIIAAHACQVFGFDPTPKSVAWVAAQALPPQFHFHPWGLGVQSGPTDFFLPQNTDHVSGSVVLQSNVSTSQKVRVELRSLGDMARQLGHSRIDVLKMDIEGAEYEVLESVLQSGVWVGQLLVEFHDRFFPDGRQKAKRVGRLLQRHGYRVFAVSDTLEEVSFIHQSLL